MAVQDLGRAREIVAQVSIQQHEIHLLDTESSAQIEKRFLKQRGYMISLLLSPVRMDK